MLAGLIASITVVVGYWTMILADAASGGGDPSIPLWAQLGVGGALVMAFIMGWIVPGWIYKALEKKYDRLVELYETRILPVIERHEQQTDRMLRVIDRLEERAARAGGREVI